MIGIYITICLDTSTPLRYCNHYCVIIPVPLVTVAPPYPPDRKIPQPLFVLIIRITLITKKIFFFVRLDKFNTLTLVPDPTSQQNLMDPLLPRLKYTHTHVRTHTTHVKRRTNLFND